MDIARFFTRIALARPSGVRGTAVVVVSCVAIGLALRLAISPLVGGLPTYLILVPPVVIAALWAGRGAGLASMALCFVGSLVMARTISGLVPFDTATAVISAVSYLTVSTLMILVASTLREALQDRERTLADLRTSDLRIDESETRFRDISDVAPVMLWTADAQGRLYVNAAFRAFWGDRPLGLDEVSIWLDAVHPDDRERVFSASLAAFQSREPLEIEARYRHADGSWRTLLTRAEPRLTAQGDFTGMVGVNIDVTAQRAAENGLRESETRFRLMADTAPSPVWLTDQDGAVEFVNAALVTFFGASAEALLGHVWKMAIHPDDIADVDAIQAGARPHHRPYAFECRFRRADGAWRWMRVSVNPRFEPGSDGQPTFRGYVGLSFDITATREALDAMAGQERRQRFLLALSDRLRDLSRPDAVMAEAIRSLTGEVGACRAGFGEPDEQPGVYRLYRGPLPGAADEQPDVAIAHLGDGIAADLERGEIVVVNHVGTDPRTADALDFYAQRGVNAFAVSPLMRGGRLRAFMQFSGPEPRAWTADELRLLDEVAERAWIEVERARAQAEVAESEARFRAIADTAPVLIWVTQKDRRRAFVNQAYVAFLGGDYDRVLAADWRSYIHPDDQDRLVRESLAGEATGQPFSLEARYLNHAGEYRWIKSFSRPRLGPRGDVLGFVGVAFDVTDIRDTNARLAASAAERDAILGQLAEGVIVTDPDGAIVFVNEAAARHHGGARLDVGPDDYAEAYSLLTDEGLPYPPHDLPLARAVERGETVTDARWRIRRPDGSEVIAVGNARPVIGPDGTRIGAVLTLRDETARIDAERRLTESEARFRMVADSAPVFIWMTDAQTRIIFTNRHYQTAFGLESETLMGAKWMTFAAPDDLPVFTSAFMDAVNARSRFQGAIRVDLPDVGLRWLRVEGVPRFDASGGFQGYVGASLDVTEAKQAEADLKRINELLEERVSEALAEKARAEADLMHAQRMEAVGRLTGGVAHDFNNLLTVVIGALDLILKSPDDAARRKKLGEAALAAARRGEGLTHQLLAFSRRQALRPEAVDLNVLIGQSAPLLQRAVGEAVDFRLKLKKGGARVSVDPAQFEAALLNLVVNARDAVADRTRKSASKIVVETQTCDVQAGDVVDLAPGAYICIVVSDNGPGMDPSIIDRVFEPFFTTKSVGKGTGLGLSQVYGFARQSGGGVQIRSTVGRGTDIRIYLPPLDPADTFAAAETATEADALPRGRRILLVEDDVGVAAVAIELLTTLGLEVEAAETAPEALDRLSRSTFDAMLSDVVMPGGMTGIELARQCAVDHPGLRILLTSGYAGDDVDEALADAPWPFLRKPYSIEQLRDALSGLLPID